MTRKAGLQYRLLLAVDIQGYSRRTSRDQLQAQRQMGTALDLAAAEAGLDRAVWETQAGGDGELALLPLEADLSRIIGDLVLGLHRALRQINQSREGSPALRLRLAIHHGIVTQGAFGPAGEAPIVVYRLLDSQPVREYLDEHPDQHLAVVISDSIYKDVVLPEFSAFRATQFTPFRFAAKGIGYQGWLHTPDLNEWNQASDALPPGSRLRRITTWKNT